MTLLGKTGIFVLFLVIYYLSLMARGFLTNRVMREAFRRRTALASQTPGARVPPAVEPTKWWRFLNAELSVLLFIVPLFLYIYLLSGFFSLPLALTFFALAQLSLLVTVILFAMLINSSVAELNRQVFWSGVLQGFANSTVRGCYRVLKAVQLLVLLLAYPALAGVAYFTLPPEALRVRIFQYTLVALVFGSFPVALFSNASIIASEDSDEESRTALFVTGAGSLIQVGLYLAVTFWAFDTARKGVAFDVGGVSLVVSLQLLLSLIAFFAITTILPYLIGVYRAKKRHVELLKKQRGWLAKLIDILDAPSAQRYAPKLGELGAEINAEGSALTENKLIQLREFVETGEVNHLLPEDAAPTYPTFLQQNSVFTYQAWLQQFSQDVADVAADLDARPTNAEKEKAAEAWARRYRERREAQNEDIETAKQTKPPVWIVGGLVIVPLISTILSKFAEWLWALFIQSSNK